MSRSFLKRSPTKVVLVGLNYKDHAKELKMPLPEEPILFLKPPTAVIGPEDSIICPAQSKRVDYEAELAVVIKDTCKDIERRAEAGFKHFQFYFQNRGTGSVRIKSDDFATRGYRGNEHAKRDWRDATRRHNRNRIRGHRDAEELCGVNWTKRIHK